jgi:hypothetical protein
MGGSPPGHDMPRVLAQEVLDPRIPQKVFFLELFNWVPIFLGIKIFLGIFCIRMDVGLYMF